MIELLLQAERALSVGLLDRAETLYRQVEASDPQNSIAVVGLARVTLERGDEAGALTLARRALAIDPENAAAQRMVQRLEEVIGYRGEALPPEPPVAPPEPPPVAEPEPPVTPTDRPTEAPAPGGMRARLARLFRRG
jgi:tetratricopeptide (TPR) repeat protein